MLEKIDSKELQKLLLLKTGKSSIADITKEDIEGINAITFSGRLMNGNKSDIDISAIRLFTGLKKVSFSDVQITQELIDYLISLGIRSIEFVRCDFGDICFPEDIDENLKLSVIGCKKVPFVFPRLKEIQIVGSNIDFERIDFSSAENVNIVECNVSNAGTTEQFENIKSINLDGSNLYDSQGERIKDILVNQKTCYSHKDKLELYDDREIN